MAVIAKERSDEASQRVRRATPDCFASLTTTTCMRTKGQRRKLSLRLASSSLGCLRGRGSYAPDRIPHIVGDKQCAILGDRDPHRPPSCISVCGQEATEYIHRR